MSRTQRNRKTKYSQLTADRVYYRYSKSMSTQVPFCRVLWGSEILPINVSKSYNGNYLIRYFTADYDPTEWRVVEKSKAQAIVSGLILREKLVKPGIITFDWKLPLNHRYQTYPTKILMINGVETAIICRRFSNSHYADFVANYGVQYGDKVEKHSAPNLEYAELLALGLYYRYYFSVG